MRTFNFFRRALLLLLIVSLQPQQNFAQDSKSAKDSMNTANVRTMIGDSRYVFNVLSVSPMKGGRRLLSPGYTLKIVKDTVTADLPYFGQVYQATPGSSEGGLKFTSTDFEYISKPRKKGGWDIVIKTKGSGSVQEMYLTVFENGSASLDVNCRDRQRISYSGELAAIKSK